MNAAFQWSPLLGFVPIALVVILAVIILVIARWKRAPDFYWRGALLLLFAALLLNPVVVSEVRKGLPDKLLIVVDESASEKIGNRNETADKALAYLQQQLKTMPNVEPVIVRAGQDPVSLKNQNTSLFAVLQDSLADIPAGQVAGTILITDGEVHDVPGDIKPWQKLAPFHVILTGKKDEFDRKVTITEAPKYGLLSQDVTIKVKIEDTGKPTDSAPIVLDVKQDGKSVNQAQMVAGQEQSFTFKLGHAGQNVFEFSVPVLQGELTGMNNTAPVIINGVRDRMKVLLVSGRPHIGERAWRDLLKSDPAIDLVHFTILRSPNSFDNTPQSQLALIAFPVDELFNKKIKDFDLIIFDKYAQYGLMLPQYFSNIANFVKNGGAFLMAMGSDKPEMDLFETPVSEILPVTPKPPEESILQGAYVPQLTDLGKTHPVTGDLQMSGGDKPWGGWLTQSDVNQTRGQTLMTGKDGRPLLILDKVGQGRVAVLTSDNIWMWSKGIDGGGPYTELLRHVAHWLMKEPELEDDYIKAEARGNTITVAERDLTKDAKSVTLTRPDGKDETVALTTQDKGWVSAKVDAPQNGIYRFSNGSKTAFAIVGTAVSEEFSDVHTTPDKLKPLVDATGGSIIWFSETPNFSLRALDAHRSSYGGSDWLGLKENAAYAVSSVKSTDLVPNWLFLVIVFGTLLFVWRRESGR
jgi:hypothetical protein